MKTVISHVILYNFAREIGARPTRIDPVANKGAKIKTINELVSSITFPALLKRRDTIGFIEIQLLSI